jgi:hypothetical protein
VTTLANGQSLTALRVTVPNSGRMVVEASAPEPVALVAGLLTFQLSDLSVLAAPMRVGMFAGQWSSSAIGGRGGWGKVLPAKGYQSPIGVLNTQVFADAALAVGEFPPVVQAPQMLPQFFERRRGVASGVFRSLSGGQIWWVNGAGVAQVGFRPPSAVTAQFDLIECDRSRGRLVIATDSPAAFAPGATFTDPQEGAFTVNSVVWTSTVNSLRGEIWIA